MFVPGSRRRGTNCGRVLRFAGEDITATSPERIVELGVVQLLQCHRIFPSLTVQDNLEIAAYPGRTRGRKPDNDRIYDFFPELAPKRSDPASSLSGGRQQILAVGQGILAEPRMLVFDEPSGGLAPIVVDRILDVAAQLAREGAAIILVEQLVEKALRHADTACVMDTGRMVRQGRAEGLKPTGTRNLSRPRLTFLWKRMIKVTQTTELARYHGGVALITPVASAPWEWPQVVA
ncbi:ABC transporter ATP-binding protein [Rhizobium daejeonense]